MDTVVALIFVDNYDEALENVDEAKAPVLKAEIEQKLYNMAYVADGILKKFEKDRYMFILSKIQLNMLIQNKFPILEDIKNILMGSETPLSLSVGVGVDGRSLKQTMDYATSAVDLALGRGGDQVVIKDKSQFSFYGGTAKEVNTDKKVRARVKAAALLDLIRESDNVIAMGHRNGDLDCIGSGLGIYRICQSMSKPCNIVLNNISPSINKLHDRLQEITEYKDVLFVDSDSVMDCVKPKTLLIVLDTFVKSMVECSELLNSIPNVVVIDHHRKGANSISNPVLIYHEPFASSTCELIAEMIPYMATRIKLTNIEADALLAGITIDTKGFTFKTGARTFEAAAYLKRVGADSIRVHMLFQHDKDMYMIKSHAVSHADIFKADLAIGTCPQNVENPNIAIAEIADELLTLSGICTSFALCELDDYVMISARSLGNLNVQVIMEEMGGGGHQTVAGARVMNKTLEEVITELKERISKHYVTRKSS